MKLHRRGAIWAFLCRDALGRRSDSARGQLDLDVCCFVSCWVWEVIGAVANWEDAKFGSSLAGGNEQFNTGHGGVTVVG